jgi:AAA-like domain/TIR domain
LRRGYTKPSRKNHRPFFDQNLEVGQRWAEEIEKQVRECDFLVVLLSADSVLSQMVVAEIEHARKYAEKQGGRPTILPIRLAYKDELPYPLSAYLNPIQHAFWESHDQTDALIRKLERAIANGGFAQEAIETTAAALNVPLPAVTPITVKLENPEGTMAAQSAFYIERDADRIALDALASSGATVTIKGARQMGKSSLLNRLVATALRENRRVVNIDLQTFDHSALTDANTFLRQLCFLVTDTLKGTSKITLLRRCKC